MYINRHLEKTILKAEKMFGSVMVCGARQTGKTTFLKKIKPDTLYLTLDDPLLLRSAFEEGASFFKNAPPPVILDEIQYAPNLFHYIKMILDSENKKGQFFLSGSQQFERMKNVSESLAGRVGVFNMPGLSLREINNSDFSVPFLPEQSYFDLHKQHLTENSYGDIWNIIHKGCMPAMHTSADMDWQMFTRPIPELIWKETSES